MEQQQKRTIKVFGIGWCIDCGRVFAFDAARFTLVDSSICHDCSERINRLRGVDGLPSIGVHCQDEGLGKYN